MEKKLTVRIPRDLDKALGMEAVRRDTSKQALVIEALIDLFADNEQVAAMLERYDWETIVHYMDDEIRETLHSYLAPCAESEFLKAYLVLHSAKYGADFAIR